MKQFAEQYGYFGVFLLSLLGASSIIIPIPYQPVLYLMGSFMDPFLIAVAGGLGSAIGELSGYIAGYYGRHMISEERKRKMSFAVKIFDHYGPLAIFVFAFTPLPDDCLFIPLGIMHYNLVKTLVPAILGKVLMCFLLAMGGKMSISFIAKLFGEEAGEWGIIGTMIVTTTLMIGIIVIMLKVDWEKVFTKYIAKEKP
jgi:membrane protein YqaA with SNARE-associated domain